MTAYEVIALADELAPNVFSSTIKLFELNRLEMRIRVDILGEDPAEVTPFAAEDLTAPESVLGSLAPGGSGGDGEITDPTNPPITGEGDDPGTGGDSGGSGSGDDSGGGSDDSGSGTEGGTGGSGSGTGGDSGGSGSGTGGDSGGSGSGDDSGGGSDDSGSGDESGSGSGSGTGADSEGGDASEDETPTGTLALDVRYRDVYVFWLIAMYYYHMGEYEEYQNKKAMFEAAWTRFERDVCIELDRATACGSAADATGKE